MSTPFDDDALQEGLGHGLYGAARNPTASPGLGQALLTGLDVPDRGYINIYRYAGEDSLNPAGHIAMSINGGHVYGKVPVPGKEAWSLAKTVPGVVQPVNPTRQPVEQMRIPANAEQRNSLMHYLQDRSTPVTYQAGTDNCANYIYNGLKGAGLKVPPLDTFETPGDLMDGLHKLYDTEAQPPQ